MANRNVKKATSKEKAANMQKQAYMRAAGYNVPQDGSWGPWQQSIWNKLTTRPKEYDTTLAGLAEGVWDKITGNDKERFNPLDQGTVTAYNPNNVDWSKTRKSQNKVVKALSETWGPLVAAATAPSLASSMAAAPIATMATLAGGTAGGYAVDKASEALTGRDLGTNIAMHTPLTPSMGEMLNPGYVAGGYGAERRMLDALYNQVTPIGYNNAGIANVIPKTQEMAMAVRDFFTPKRIRTSVNDMPAWQQRIRQNISSNDYGMLSADVFRDDAWRLAMRQKPRTIDINGKEHSLYVKNPDNKTYSYDLDYINQKRHDAGLPPLRNIRVPIFADKTALHEGINNVTSGDVFTGNGGHVGLEMDLPKNWDNPTPFGYSIIDTDNPLRFQDKWDTQPFLDPNRSIAPAFSRWLTRHPNKLTNYIRNFDAVEGVGGNPFMLDMQVEPNVFRDIIIKE